MKRHKITVNHRDLIRSLVPDARRGHSSLFRIPCTSPWFIGAAGSGDEDPVLQREGPVGRRESENEGTEKHGNDPVRAS